MIKICHFVSWIEYEDQIYFLDDNKLNTKEGRKLLNDEFKDDLSGHGAIRYFYPELKSNGIDRECIDFSSPKNFPPEIVKAIKAGLFENFGICPDILLKPAWAEYEKIKQAAWAEYYKIKQAAWAEYEKINQAAWAEYYKIKQPARAEYEKIMQAAFWKVARIKKNRRKEWK